MRYFNLFSNILITKGKTRMVLSDLQKCISELFPNEFYELINDLKSSSIEELKARYGEDSSEIVEEYITFLIENDYGFITKHSWDNKFPPLKFEIDDSEELSNMVVELDDISIIESIKRFTEKTSIKHVVIISYKNLSYNDFLYIESNFVNSNLLGIEIFTPYYPTIDRDFITNLSKNTTRIYGLIFFNCKKSPFKVKDEFRFVVNFVKENVKMTSCGKVDLKYFNTNLPKVLEAINHNSCLHKKIAIDIDGNIKNCPSMPQSFDNIKDTTLEEALNHKDFKKYWNITKDEIVVCKDCEFRYICTDCRAYTERTHLNKEGLDISKPLKCGYDPYKGEWQEWSKNPLKEKTIKHYKLNETI